MKMIHTLTWRLRSLLAELGWPGVSAIALLAATAAAYVWILTPLRAEIVDMKKEALSLRQKSKVPSVQVKELNPAEQLVAFYQFFPSQDGVADGMERIYGAAIAQGVALERGDYQLAGERDSKLVRYDIGFPVKGGYLQIRKFIAQILNDVPNASLDSVIFNRQRINDSMIDAQLKFSLYVRQQ